MLEGSFLETVPNHLREAFETITCQIEEVKPNLSDETYDTAMRLLAGLINKNEELVKVKISRLPEDTRGLLWLEWDRVFAMINNRGFILIRENRGKMIYEFSPSNIQKAISVIHDRQFSHRRSRELSESLKKKLLELSEFQEDEYAKEFTPQMLESLESLLLSLKERGILEPEIFAEPNGSIAIHWDELYCSFFRDGRIEIAGEHKELSREEFTELIAKSHFVSSF